MVIKASRKKDINRTGVKSELKFQLDDDWLTSLPTNGEIKKMFGPAKTLGASDDLLIAADAALENAGTYRLIEHGMEMGYSPYVHFLGYSVLTSLTQNGLVAAAISTVADDMTRAWISLEHSDPDYDFTPIKKEMQRLEIKELIQKAALLNGYFGGCLIFIDTASRGQSLTIPLNLSEKSAEMTPGALRAFTIIEPLNCFPGDYNCIDPLSPFYFVPQNWWIQSQKVHASRFIHLTSNLPPVLLRPSYNFFGIPQAQIIYDYILHFQQCRLSAQRLLNNFSLTALKTDMSAVLSGGGAGDLEARTKYFVQKSNNDGLFVIDKETEDLLKLDTSLSGVADIVRQSLELVAAINRTPAVKLLGISPSGFNATGESDLRNYYDHVKGQQEKQLRHAIEKILQIIQLNIYGHIDPHLSFSFNHLSEEDELARAEIDKIKAETEKLRSSMEKY